MPGVDQEPTLDAHGNEIEGRTCVTCEGRGLCPTCNGKGQVIDPSEVHRPATQALDTQALNNPEAVSADAISAGAIPDEGAGLTHPRPGSPTLEGEGTQPDEQQRVQEQDIAAAEANPDRGDESGYESPGSTGPGEPAPATEPAAPGDEKATPSS